MKATDSGLRAGRRPPEPRRSASRPELNAPEVPELSIAEYEPLLDSANARPADWLRIARDIAEHRAQLRRLRRPARHRHDGLHRLRARLPAARARQAGGGHGLADPARRAALRRAPEPADRVLVAARDDVREVCLVFGSQILRGCRAVKASASGFEAFDSPEPAAARRGGRARSRSTRRGCARRRPRRGRAAAGARRRRRACCASTRACRRRCCARRWPSRSAGSCSRPTARARSPTPTRSCSPRSPRARAAAS